MRSIDLKIERAHIQIDRLCQNISTWASNNPIKTSCKLRENRLGFLLILEDFDTPAPLENFGILFGECIHNLRSSLDNLAFSLALLHSDTPTRPKDIFFPIFMTQEDFNKNSQRSLNQLPREAAILIEEIQPFQRSDDKIEGTPSKDALALLHSLSNQDKHRTPIIALLAPKKIDYSHSIEFYSEDDAILSLPPEVNFWADVQKPGVILLEQKTNKPVKSVTGSFNCLAQVAISINDSLEPLDISLRYLHWYTKLVIDQFRKFFD